MQKDKDCIFCKIAAGEIPCTKIYEDDDLLAFMDIMPLNRGHLLVIPKEHFGNILEIEPALYGRIAELICRLSRAVGSTVSPDGMNVLQLNGKAANQVVPHLHMHLVPRFESDGLSISAWDPVPGDTQEIAATAEAILAEL